jgi:hypothetical protein
LKVRTFKELGALVPSAFKPHFTTPFHAFSWAYDCSTSSAPTTCITDIRKRWCQPEKELTTKHMRVVEKVQAMIGNSLRDMALRGAVVQFTPKVKALLTDSTTTDALLPAFAVKADMRALTMAQLRDNLQTAQGERVILRGGILDQPYSGGRMTVHMKNMYKKYRHPWNEWADHEWTLDDFKSTWNNLQALCSNAAGDWAKTKWVIFGTASQVCPALLISCVHKSLMLFFVM